MREGEKQFDPEQENMETKRTPEQDRSGKETGKVPESWEKFGEVPAEVSRELSSAKETLAESFWGRPADFAESAAKQGLGQELGAFLKKFSELNDEALASARLRSARERVVQKLPPAA